MGRPLGTPRRTETGRGRAKTESGEDGAGGRAGGLAPRPGRGELGGAGRGAGGAEGGGAGRAFGALRRGGWRPPGRAGRVCVRALPLREEDGPGGKVGVTRAAPGRLPGGTEESPTERRPPGLGGAQSGRRRRHRARPLTAGGRGKLRVWVARGARAGARWGARLRDGLRPQHPCLTERRDLLPGLR